MAYRQLFCVACVFVGLGLVGCGGESASSATDPMTNDSAPGNPDAPPSGADDTPPPSDDQPPGNADSPPGSTDSPGGSLQSLCEDVCQFFEDVNECLEEGQEVMDLDELCSGGCAMLPEPSEPIPCQQEMEAMFDCILGLGSLCSSDGSEAQAAMCEDEATRYTDCAEQEGVPIGGPGDSCTLENNCQQCEDLCETCLCASADAPEECTTICDQ